MAVLERTSVLGAPKQGLHAPAAQLGRLTGIGSELRPFDDSLGALQALTGGDHHLSEVTQHVAALPGIGAAVSQGDLVEARRASESELLPRLRGGHEG